MGEEYSRTTRYFHITLDVRMPHAHNTHHAKYSNTSKVGGKIGLVPILEKNQQEPKYGLTNR